MLNYYPRVANFIPFCSTITRFPDNWAFWFLHRLQWWIWKSKNSLKIGNSKFKNLKSIFVRTIRRNIQDKFENNWPRFVGGIAFWKFHSHVNLTPPLHRACSCRSEVCVLRMLWTILDFGWNQDSCYCVAALQDVSVNLSDKGECLNTTL